MDELFTPQDTIDHYIQQRGITVNDIGVAPTVIISWGRLMVEQLAGEIDARVPNHWMYGDRQPFYSGEASGKSLSIVQLPVGAPGTVMIMEEMIAAGARTFIGVGWAGSLQRDVMIGDFILPTSCISEEGTSAHYFEDLPDLSPDLELANALEASAEEHGVSIRKGVQWTTDAPYRELRSKVSTYRSQGVLGVDMETSAMYALGKYRGVRVCNLLIISDVLDSDWKPAFGSERIKKANKLARRIVLDSI
jgi:uridine phosphorylase